MRVGVEIKDRDIFTIIQILNSRVGNEVGLKDILTQMLKRNVCSSDPLFLILQKLERERLVEGRRGFIKVIRKIEEDEAKEIAKEIKLKVVPGKGRVSQTIQGRKRKDLGWRGCPLSSQLIYKRVVEEAYRRTHSFGYKNKHAEVCRKDNDK